VIAFTAQQNIILIQLVPHTSHIAQPLDLFFFFNFKNLYKKEKERFTFRGETRKICRALGALNKGLTIQNCRYSFRRAGYVISSLNPDGTISLDPDIVLRRICATDVDPDTNFAMDDEYLHEYQRRQMHRIRYEIPETCPNAINLAAWGKVQSGMCPLCRSQIREGPSESLDGNENVRDES
jgi:hypothetical protein